MDLQDRYDELDNIIRKLDVLIDDISIKDYINQLNEIKYEAQKELEEIEPQLQKEYDLECERQLNEYIKSVI